MVRPDAIERNVDGIVSMKATFMKTENSNGYKWFALILIWGAAFCQQSIRQIYGATLPSITQSLGVSSVEIGFVGTIFTFVYGATVIFAGFLSDLISRKWVLISGMLLFAVGGFFSGFASCVGALAFTYGVLNGLGQPLVFPPGMSLLMQLHGENTRATALSILQSAIYIGIMFGAIGSGFLSGLEADGWRGAFKIAGAVALVWVALSAFAMRNTQVETPSAGKASFKEAVVAVFSKKAAILYGIYLVILNGVTIGFTIWTPCFVMDAFPDLPKGTAVMHAVLWMYLGAIGGVLLGGWAGDRLALRRNGVRLEILTIGVLGGGIAWFCVARSTALVGCCLSLAAAGFFRGILDSNLNVPFFDVIKPRYHASALGFMLGLSYVFGSVAPVVLGWMREYFSLRAGIMTFPAFYLSALGLILLSRYRYYLKEREN